MSVYIENIGTIFGIIILKNRQKKIWC